MHKPQRKSPQGRHNNKQVRSSHQRIAGRREWSRTNRPFHGHLADPSIDQTPLSTTVLCVLDSDVHEMEDFFEWVAGRLPCFDLATATRVVSNEPRSNDSFFPQMGGCGDH
jgi:hypothetical protein